MAGLNEQDREKVKEYLSHPIMFPPAFKDYISDWFATNIPKIPLSQVFGFQLWGIHSADDILSSESTSSTSYVDLATVGPTLSNLANGFYIVMWGAQVGDFSTTQTRTVGLSVDGAAPTSEAEAFGQAGAIGKVSLVDLTAGDGTHELKLKYKVSAGTWSFDDRWLHALRVVTE